MRKKKTYQLRIMEFMQDAVSLKRDGKTIASWSAPSHTQNHQFQETQRRVS